MYKLNGSFSSSIGYSGYNSCSSASAFAAHVKKANKPINPPVITSITVETYGVDYGKPKTVEPFDYYSYMMRQYYGSSSSSSIN